MSGTRREALKRGLLFGAAAMANGFMPSALLRSAFAAPGPQARNLVFVELDGGNDGLNTIVPHGIDGGLYAKTYRPTLGIPAETTIPLNDSLGFNPNLAPLMPLFDSGRMAVVQGVGSPLGSFSHDFAKKFWATGDPTGETTSGWFGRYLATLPGSKSLAFDVSNYADGLFAGSKQFVAAFPSLESLAFPIDKKHPDDGWARKKAFLAMHSTLAGSDTALGAIAATGEKLIDVLAQYSKVKPVAHVGKYPQHPVGDALALVVRLLRSSLGLRFHHVVFEGFDTHANQDQGFSHDQKLATLAKALAAFHADLDHYGLAKNTLVIVYSEFGRALFENASRGTDHGTAAPVFVLGDGVAGGLYGVHPSLEPRNLSSIEEMVATTDYRDVLGTIAMRWLDADPAPLFPDHVMSDLGFIS